MKQVKVMARWQPMSTAPKDGREIIAVLANGDITIRVRWNGKKWKNDHVDINDILQGWIPIKQTP